MKVLRTLFSEGFRIFFLAAGLFAVISIGLWIAWLGIHAVGGMVTRMPFAPPPHLWHAHEMIFGYAGAALGGFFLTAVPSWTGTAAARHLFVATASGLWLAGRLAIWWSGSIDPLIVALIDLAFLPLLASKIASQLFRRPKPQNLLFLLLLTLIWSGNLLVHLEWMAMIEDGVWPGLRLGLLGIAAMITVLGGRITPAFTHNAMTRKGIENGLPKSHKALEAIGIASGVLLPLLLVFGARHSAVAAIAIIAGFAQFGRLAGWRSFWTIRQPILWSLHLGFAMLAAGYLTLGFSYLDVISEVAALHLLGIGAVGGMTLAVMSRAILGHSGRPLTVSPAIALAYLCVAAAALVRASGSIAGLGWYNTAMLISGGLWIVAFTIFVAVYFPMVIETRSKKTKSPSTS